MSHSYRRPYLAIAGGNSAAEDKKTAARGVRHVQNHILRNALKRGLLEDLLLPHKYECPWNETYNWGRDGGKLYWGDYPNKSERWYQRMLRK